MGTKLIVKGLFISIAIFILGLFRPMPCRRTVSISEDYLEKSDRRIILGCYTKCLMLKSGRVSKFQVKTPYMEGCFKRCVDRQIHKEAVLGMAPSKKFVILGPDVSPSENIIVPSRMPHLPKKLYKDVGARRWHHGDCDVFDMQRKIDVSVKSAMLLDHVGVTCVSNDELLVSWEQPNGLTNCTGYQVNYRLGGGHSESDRIYCFDVDKDKTTLVINKDKGFHGQQEIYLAVTALPLPFKCDIELQKFEPCRGEELKRQRRNINPTPPFVIVTGSGPTGLVMPSVIPTLPQNVLDPFHKYRNNSNCRPPQPSFIPSLYAGYANVFNVNCRQSTDFTKKAFVVHWEQPKDYRIVPYTHFQVIYKITPRKHTATPRLYCHEVEKNTLSHTVEDVESVDTIDIVVVPYPNYGKLNETMQKFTPCLPTTAPPSNQATNSKVGPVRVEVAVGSSIAVVVALVILVVLLIFLRRRTHDPPVDPIKQEKIYVSYYPDSKKYRSSLLNLVSKLRELYWVNLIMDSYCETGVAELGIARWCQKQLSESTRVLMVISKEYLKICEKWQNGLSDELESGDVNVNRVCSELQYISDHIFEKRKNSFLTIVLADVKQLELPTPFRGMKSFAWPKNEDDERDVVCNICAKESLVVS